MAECISSLCSDDAISEEQLSTPGRGLNLTEFELAVRKVDRQKLRRTVSFSNKPSEIFVIDNVPEPFRVDCHSGEGLLHHLEATYEVVTLLCFAGQLMKERKYIYLPDVIGPNHEYLILYALDDYGSYELVGFSRLHLNFAGAIEETRAAHDLPGGRHFLSRYLLRAVHERLAGAHPGQRRIGLVVWPNQAAQWLPDEGYSPLSWSDPIPRAVRRQLELENHYIYHDVKDCNRFYLWCQAPEQSVPSPVKRKPMPVQEEARRDAPQKSPQQAPLKSLQNCGSPRRASGGGQPGASTKSCASSGRKAEPPSAGGSGRTTSKSSHPSTPRLTPKGRVHAACGAATAPPTGGSHKGSSPATPPASHRGAPTSPTKPRGRSLQPRHDPPSLKAGAGPRPSRSSSSSSRSRHGTQSTSVPSTPRTPRAQGPLFKAPLSPAVGGRAPGATPLTPKPHKKEKAAPRPSSAPARASTGRS